MKHFLLIALFALGVSLVYTGVGQLLPQLENRPPPEVKAGSSIGPEELAAAGAAIFSANCAQCHKIGEKGRGPDLAGVGSRAAERAKKRAADTRKEYAPVDYLFETLCRPGDFVVEGFPNIMPPQGRALSGGQLLAAVAFLQSLGGEPTIKGTDVKALERFGCGAESESGGTTAGATEPVGPPEKIFEKFGCSGCHSATSDARLTGPGFKGLGQRAPRSELFESILDPDAKAAVVDPPYPKGMMKATLEGNGFYRQMTPADYAALVDWLSKL